MSRIRRFSHLSFVCNDEESGCAVVLYGVRTTCDEDCLFPFRDSGKRSLTIFNFFLFFWASFSGYALATFVQWAKIWKGDAGVGVIWKASC